MVTMFSEEQKEKFDASGYLVIENFITDIAAAELRKLVIEMASFEKKVVEGYYYPFDKSGLTQRVWNFTNKSKRFRDLLNWMNCLKL